MSDDAKSAAGALPVFPFPVDANGYTVLANVASQAVMRRIGMSRIEDGDFAHPNLAVTDPLSRHVLYVAEADRWTYANGRS